MATLLIIDDEPGIVEEVKSFFEEEGHQVHTADTGEEGLRLAQKLKPDMVLIDMKLPDTPGIQILAAVKRLLPRAKTIVVTGYVDQSIIDEAEKLGRDSFLPKPFDLETLKNEVDRLLRA